MPRYHDKICLEYESYLNSRSSQETNIVAVCTKICKTLLRFVSGHIVSVATYIYRETYKHSWQYEVVSTEGEATSEVPSLGSAKGGLHNPVIAMCFLAWAW